MNFKDGISVLLLCGLMSFSITECQSCKGDYNTLTGQSVKITKFNLEGIHEIKWTQNIRAGASREVIKRIGSVIKKQISKDVSLTQDGSLVLSNIQKDNAGVYNVEGFDAEGSVKTDSNAQAVLCVFEKVSKPKVNFTCTNQKADIKCEVTSTESLTFRWYKNAKFIEATETNSIKQSDIKDNAKFQCNVSNPADSNVSDEVSVTCSKSSSGGDGDKLFGFDFWIMVGILAGGGGLVLLLLIVLVTCACRTCKRREKHMRDEEELRLNTFDSPLLRSKNTARGQPAPPVPQEDPEVSSYEVNDPPTKTHTKTRNPNRVRPPPPPIDEEDPPPLPQPRKKVPHAKKNQGPMYMQP